MRAVEEDPESSDEGSGLSGAEAEENYNENGDEDCGEIDSVSRDEQIVFPRAEENDNARPNPQDISAEGGSCSLSSWLDTTEEKEIDGSTEGGSCSLSSWLDTTEEKEIDGSTEGGSCSLSSWLDTTEEKEIDGGLPEEKNTENTSDQNVLLQRIPIKEESQSEGITEPSKKKYRFGLRGNDIETESTSDQIAFSQQLPTNESSQLERIFKPREPEIITDRIRTDENLHQSSAMNPCDKGKQPMSGPSRAKYSSVPHFQQELENLTAGGFGVSERVGGSLVGGREKLPEIPEELGSHSSARSSKEIYQKEVIVLDSDNSVSSLRHSPSAEKFTVRDADSYEDDVKNRPENVEDSKPMHGSTDDQDP